jgi:hypothetical protein
MPRTIMEYRLLAIMDYYSFLTLSNYRLKRIRFKRSRLKRIHIFYLFSHGLWILFIDTACHLHGVMPSKATQAANATRQ